MLTPLQHRVRQIVASLPGAEDLGALRDEGLAVERIQVAEGFARLVVSSGQERTTVDLAWDARIFPPEQTPEGPVLAEEELHPCLI